MSYSYSVLFHRGMAWKREARARLEKRRTEILGPCGEARGRPQGDRCDLNSSESRPHSHTSKLPVQPGAGTAPGRAGRSCRTSREYTTGYLAVGIAYSDRGPRIRVSDPKTVISRQKLLATPRRRLSVATRSRTSDCPLRNPCRATHSSSGVERLPWE